MNIGSLTRSVMVFERIACKLRRLVDEASAERAGAVVVDLLKDCLRHADGIVQVAAELGYTNRTLPSQLSDQICEDAEQNMPVGGKHMWFIWNKPWTVSELRKCQHSLIENYQSITSYAYVSFGVHSSSLVAHHHTQCKWRWPNVLGTANPTTASESNLPAAATGRLFERGNEATSQPALCLDFRVAQ